MSSARRFRRAQSRRARVRCEGCGQRATGWLLDIALCIPCRDAFLAEMDSEALSADVAAQLAEELSAELGYRVTVELVDAAHAAELIDHGGCGRPGCMGVAL
jgi:hypothetical protein